MGGNGIFHGMIMRSLMLMICNDLRGGSSGVRAHREVVV
jgi:hypothetical protein